MRSKRKSKSWNKNLKNLKIVCWNPWGLCNERFVYCRALNYDVIGLTELHNTQNKKQWKNKVWITSEDSQLDDDGNVLDPATGDGILLSPIFAKKVLGKGSSNRKQNCLGSSGGPYLPSIHCVCLCSTWIQEDRSPRTRHSQATERPACRLQEKKKSDCLIIMGDMNCELQRNVPGCCGKWFMNKRPDNGHSDDLLTVMREHDLFAVDSMFRPKRSRMFCNQRKRVCNATYLQKHSISRPKKLDYFLVSNRWRSSVTSSSTKWAPSIHRFGKSFDHWLL